MSSISDKAKFLEDVFLQIFLLPNHHCQSSKQDKMGINNSTTKFTTAKSSSKSDLVAVSGKPFKNSLFFSRPVLNCINIHHVTIKQLYKL